MATKTTRKVLGVINLPHRVWERTAQGGWVSRAWYKGEPQAYAQTEWPNHTLGNLNMLDIGGVCGAWPSAALERQAA